MTNEQLAILLRSYLKRLRVVLKDIQSAFPAEAETMRADEWWDGEERVSIEERVIASLTQEDLESRGCELRPTGCILILDELGGFMSDLSRDISRLGIDTHLSASTRLGAGKGT